MHPYSGMGDKSIRFQLEFTFLLTIWAFIVPSASAAVLFFRGALQKPDKAGEVDLFLLAKAALPVLPTVGVTQTFTVTTDVRDVPDSVDKKKYRFT